MVLENFNFTRNIDILTVVRLNHATLTVNLFGDALKKKLNSKKRRNRLDTQYNQLYDQIVQ